MRDLIKDTPLIDTEKEREEKKTSGPRTQNLYVMRRVFYHCATTAAFAMLYVIK